MFLRNPKSTRHNVFRDVYDDPVFKNVLSDTARVPDFPFLVDVELTNHCNLKCIMCPRVVMTREQGFMSRNVFVKTVDECAERRTPLRLIRFGEPFLHPNIIEFCTYAKSKGLPLHITNNGLAVTEQQLRAIVDLEVDSLIFSFQGATRQQYELVRNNSKYDRLVESILTLVSVRGEKPKPFIHVSTTVLDESKEEIEDFCNYWRNIVDSVGVGRTNLSIVPVHKLPLEAVDKIADQKRRETLAKVYMPCTEVYQKLSVDWDGKVTCCCGDYDACLTVGDVTQDTISNIWNSSPSLDLVRRMLDLGLHKSLTLCSTCYHTYEDF